ncbi:hypothetical protein [Corynebacterium tapiri]|uniref:Uncharacterized protein n=1 Tax=Corynebacterium tapiri TaxID=1448266 RepID=A0A5C4U523_9CORY|nr:hypothetical protein [Corynebacterium tapiri]TNL98772.1 hypothetical protein FHE74_03905 [Corynebacterium tapiri]
MGLRLRWLCDGTDRLNWRDLLVIVRQCGHDSALVRHSMGDAASWSVDTHILAGLLDGVNGLLWQGSGGKGGKPKPMQRPTMGKTAQAPEGKPAPVPEGDPFKDDESGVFRGEMTPLGELNEWLGWVD